jgi:hypothetical protein
MNRVYLNNLFDIYESLLNDREKEIFSSYYEEDLSLSEIADNLSVTRNAVHKTIKTVEEKLLNYETKLRIYDKKESIIKAIEDKDYDKIIDILN